MPKRGVKAVKKLKKQRIEVETEMSAKSFPTPSSVDENAQDGQQKADSPKGTTAVGAKPRRNLVAPCIIVYIIAILIEITILISMQKQYASHCSALQETMCNSRGSRCSQKDSVSAECVCDEPLLFNGSACVECNAAMSCAGSRHKCQAIVDIHHKIIEHRCIGVYNYLEYVRPKNALPERLPGRLLTCKDFLQDVCDGKQDRVELCSRNEFPYGIKNRRICLGNNPNDYCRGSKACHELAAAYSCVYPFISRKGLVVCPPTRDETRCHPDKRNIHGICVAKETFAAVNTNIVALHRRRSAPATFNVATGDSFLAWVKLLKLLNDAKGLAPLKHVFDSNDLDKLSDDDIKTKWRTLYQSCPLWARSAVSISVIDSVFHETIIGALPSTLYFRYTPYSFVGSMIPSSVANAALLLTNATNCPTVNETRTTNTFLIPLSVLTRCLSFDNTPKVSGILWYATVVASTVVHACELHDDSSTCEVSAFTFLGRLLPPVTKEDIQLLPGLRIGDSRGKIYWSGRVAARLSDPFYNKDLLEDLQTYPPFSLNDTGAFDKISEALLQKAV